MSFLPREPAAADPRGRDREVVTGPPSLVGGPLPQRTTGDRPRTVGIPALLVFDQVSKWYGPLLGLNGASLRLATGITGLVGPNGAGKSTLMKLATGQLRPDLGRVTIQGVPACRASAKRYLGFCPETDAFYEEMSGRAFVNNMARLYGFRRTEARERTASVLKQVGMEERADRRLRGYSKGMRQRIKLAQALVHDPSLLILDEPLNGVDPTGRQELCQLFAGLAAQGKSLLISSHQLEELEKLTDRVIVLARGVVVAQGTVMEIRDLLEDQPLTVRIDSDRPRELAAALLRLPDVLGVELGGGTTVLARAHNPQRFFRSLSSLILHDAFDVQRLETLDCSAQAILDYVLRSQ